jgi:hypothetical protein
MVHRLNVTELVVDFAAELFEELSPEMQAAEDAGRQAARTAFQVGRAGSLVARDVLEIQAYDA